MARIKKTTKISWPIRPRPHRRKVPTAGGVRKTYTHSDELKHALRELKHALRELKHALKKYDTDRPKSPQFCP